MRRLLTLCILALCITATASGQTTVPTTQITLEYSSAGQPRTAKIILANDVLARLQTNTATDEDLQALLDALKVSIGDVNPPTVNPCDRPFSRLINDGRPVSNCTEVK